MIGLVLVAILGTLLYRRKKRLRRRRDHRAAATTREGLVEGPAQRIVQNGDRRLRQPTAPKRTISSNSGTLVTPHLSRMTLHKLGSEYERHVRLRLHFVVCRIITTTLPLKYSQPNPQSPTSPVSSRSGNQALVTHQPPPEYSQIASGRYTGMRGGVNFLSICL